MLGAGSGQASLSLRALLLQAAEGTLLRNSSGLEHLAELFNAAAICQRCYLATADATPLLGRHRAGRDGGSSRTLIGLQAAPLQRHQGSTSRRRGSGMFTRNSSRSGGSRGVSSSSAAAMAAGGWFAMVTSWVRGRPTTQQLEQKMEQEEDVDDLGEEESEEQPDQPLGVSVQAILAVGGPAAHEAAATLQYLQSRAGLSEQEAKSVLYRIANFKNPKGHCSLLVPPRFVSCEGEVKPVVDFLLAMPGITIQRCLTKSPHILVDSPLARMESNKRRLMERLEMQPREMGRLVTAYPYVLQEDLSKRLFPLFDFLGSLGLSVAQQRAIVTKNTTALAYSLNRVKQRVVWLQQVGLTDEQLRTAIWKFFRIVCVNDSTAQRGVDWLLEQGVPRDKLTATITRLPSVIVYGPEKCEAFLAVLRGELGLPQETITRVLVNVPDTLGRSPDLLRRNVEVMRTAVGFTDDDQIRRFVHGNPGVLRMDLSSPTYKAKLRFLREVLQAEDVCSTLLVHPFYISYRLDRIASRGCYMKAVHRNPLGSITNWLGSGESLFCKVHARTSLADYHAWLAGWRESAEGRYWLGEATRRQHKMTKARLALDVEAEAAATKKTETALAEEVAAAAGEAR